MKKGSISVDFLFTFVAVILLTLFLIMLTLSLCLMEVTQYITYASAREYFISHKSLGEQELASQDKFNQLKNQFFPSTFNNWFELDKQTRYLGVNAYETPTDTRTHNLFIGVQAIFVSKVLGMNNSFFGSGMDNFEIDMRSYLGREASQQECQSFFTKYKDQLIDTSSVRQIVVIDELSCPSGDCSYEC